MELRVAAALARPRPLWRGAISAGVCACSIAAALVLAGCTKHDTTDPRHFVGKWHSSRLTTPLYLYGNGDWEIRTDEGAVLQYGVWAYQNHLIMWSYKAGATISHDVNAVLSATPTQFQLHEADQSTTTFDKLDQAGP